jgi:hypothetical protein
MTPEEIAQKVKQRFPTSERERRGCVQEKISRAAMRSRYKKQLEQGVDEPDDIENYFSQQ